MEALQRRAVRISMRNSTSTSVATLLRHAHRRGQTPRRGSVALSARAAIDKEDNRETSPGWSQLASKATALALAAAMSLSSPVEVSASTLTPPPSSTSTSSSTSLLPRSLVVTNTIDYERVARARSAMEKRKKKETESDLLEKTSTADPTSTSTSTSRRRDISSELPSPDEADALLQFDRDAYTDDAWEAMKT